MSAKVIAYSSTNPQQKPHDVITKSACESFDNPVRKAVRDFTSFRRDEIVRSTYNPLKWPMKFDKKRYSSSRIRFAERSYVNSHAKYYHIFSQQTATFALTLNAEQEPGLQ